MKTKRTRLAGDCLAALFIALLAGCGAETKTGSTGTGIAPPPTSVAATASGPISSLGPLGVAGTSLDDVTTQVLLNTEARRMATELRLGMFADASGTVFRETNAGSALSAVAQSRVVGPVTLVDAAKGELRVLGVLARVDENTLLEGLAGLGGVATGDAVEVYGLELPGAQGMLATRLIARPASPDANVEILGVAGEIGTASLVAQGVPVNLANVQLGVANPSMVQFSPPPAITLVPGALIRVIGKFDPSTGVVNATSIATGFAPTRAEGTLAYVEGFVDELSGATRYKVGGVQVDASAAAVPVAAGTRVVVRGNMQSNVLLANQVRVIPAGTRIEYTVEGAVDGYTSVASFSVRGERVDASQAVFFGGMASVLADGRRVRVRGVAGPGRLTATEVTIIS
jgi:hypothetical protein